MNLRPPTQTVHGLPHYTSFTLFISKAHMPYTACFKKNDPISNNYIFFFLALQPPLGVVFYSPLTGFSLLAYEVSDHIQRRATVGRTPLNEWSVRRRDLYLTTHNTHNRQTSMPRVGFEPTISTGERPKTYALDRAATGTGRPTLVC